MDYKSVKGYTGWTQMGFLFVFMGLGFIVAGGIQALLTMQMLPSGTKMTDTEAIMKAMLAPENINLTRTLQVLSTFGLMFIPALLWNYVSNGKSLLWLGFSKYLNGWQIVLGFMIIYAAAVAVAPLGDISKSIVAHFPRLDAVAKKMEDTYNAQTMAMSNLKNVPEYITGLFIMAFFPAMFEEVFFRGAMQNFLVRWWKNPLVAIIVTSIIFSMIHMSIYLFLSRMALGFVLGLMFYKTKNIWVNIFAHFINNAIVLTMLFVGRKKMDKISVSDMDQNFHWSIGLAGVIVLVGLFFLLDKYAAKSKARIEAQERLLIAEADPYSGIAKKENN